MKKFKLFIDNFLIYGIGGIIHKIIPFVMVPIITRLMPNSTYFGISDMANTVVSFGTAIAIVGMYDAMFRLFFEKEDEQYKRTVCSSAYVFVLGTSFAIAVFMLVFRTLIAKYFLGDENCTNIVIIAAVTSFLETVNTIVAAPTRMENKRKTYLVVSSFGPLISYSISVVLLLRGYYLLALPLGFLLSSLTINIVYIILNHKCFKPGCYDTKIIKTLFIIGAPMAVNTLTYWVFNSSDRFMITNLMEVGDTGVYSIGSKFGHASQLVYTAFAAGWQYFAFSTMNEKNQVESNSKVFEYLGAVSYVASMFVCALSYPMFRILFPEEYLPGYIVAPYLFLAPLLLMLFQVISNQFLIIKKTWPNMLILFFGAAVNILMNYYLIKMLGIEGAAIATLVGYVAALTVAAIVLIRMKLLKINSRFYICSLIMLIIIILWRMLFSQQIIVSLALSVAGSVVIMILYREDLLLLYNGIRNKNK